MQRKLNKITKQIINESKRKSVKWTGATWSVSGNNVTNTPTLGSEMLIDGGLENWTTTTNLTNWSESIAGTSTVQQETTLQRTGSSATRLNIDNVNSSALVSQSLPTTIGNWYYCLAWARSLTSSPSARLQFSGFTTVVSDSTLSTNYTSLVATGRATATTVSVSLNRLNAANLTIIYDDSTFKSISLTSLFACVTGLSSNLTATAKIVANPSGTQAGIVSLLDSTSSPANFLIAYHDGTNVKLEKCVAGSYTTLVTTAVTFVANATIEIRRPSGNTFQLWYNGAQIDTDQTVSDSEIINNNLYGMFSTYSGNLISEFSLGGVVIPFTF